VQCHSRWHAMRNICVFFFMGNPIKCNKIMRFLYDKRNEKRFWKEMVVKCGKAQVTRCVSG
jgi:hypothetical protein